MDHEATVGQTFRLDLVLDVDLSAASRSDKLAHTVGYDQIVMLRVSPSAPADIDWSSCGWRGRRSCAQPVPASLARAGHRHKPHAPLRRPLPTWESPSSAAVRTVAEALVALGGNLGDVRDTIDRAVATFLR